MCCTTTALVTMPFVLFPRRPSCASVQDTNWYSDVYTGTYYLEAHIHVRNGATLEISGQHPDEGDCKTLLLVRKRYYSSIHRHYISVF